jgi:Ser/Thr protein kinase RdoA (MazF antagonist)
VLEQEDVARYLLDAGLMGPEAVLDGDLVIRDVSSRNRNFRVETRNGPCYLLKQGVTAETVAGVGHEAAIYQQLMQVDSGLTQYVPRFYAYDPAPGVLVLELVRGAEDLRTAQLRTGTFSAGPGAQLGSALGALHRATRELVGPASPTTPPWILWVHRPNAQLFRDVSAASLELIRIVQGAAGFPEALERLRDRWEPASVVHGDVKWDNCLLTEPGDGGEALKLIDWEAAMPGDPRWDLGSALSHYLSFWLFSIPVTGTDPPERFPELAAYPLDSMKSALAACWLAYLSAYGLEARPSSDWLLGVIEFAAARLVQTAFEAAQMMQQLTSSIVLHLQLALNVLERPQEAATRLLGLPLGASGGL